MIAATAGQPFVAYVDGAPTGLVGTIGVQVRDENDNVIITRTTIGISEVEPGSGIYQWNAPAAPSLPGSYLLLWDTNGTDESWASEPMTVLAGQILPTPYVPPGAVTDLRDLRVLIPACRRAIDGPTALASGSVSVTLDDQEVLALVADATAELILNTASRDGSVMNAFGNQLVVAQRDPFYLAPIAWMTDQPRSTAQDAAILSQAALNHYFWMLKGMKTSETMKNEAVEWTYTILSPAVLLAWIQYLIGNRDKAIAALQSINVVMDVYISLVAERDRLSATWLEPWVTEIGAPVPYVGGGGQGPLEYDYRFNTWG